MSSSPAYETDSELTLNEIMLFNTPYRSLATPFVDAEGQAGSNNWGARLRAMLTVDQISPRSFAKDKKL